MDGYGRWILFVFGTLAAGRQVVYLVGIACILLISSLVWWWVARDLPVAWSLGMCGCTSAVDGVDENDAVLGMSCAVGTRPEVLGVRQDSSWVGLPHGK